MTATEPRRDVGRPRIFSNEAIFHAVYVVMRRDGYPELTLEAVASEVGCTRQALVRRFGSKRNLLLAALDGSAPKISSDYEQVRKTWDSPLAALHARYILPPNSRPELGNDPRPQANTLAYILTTSGDPDFAMRFAALVQLSLQEVEQFLMAAVEDGELKPLDTSVLARTLHAAWTGETILWAADQSVTYAESLSEMFEQIIGPYRTSLSAVHATTG